MRIEIIDSIEKLLPFKAEWESILEEMNSDNVFTELDWIICRWKYLEDKHKLLILIVINDQEVIGICPLMTTNRGICKEISFIGSRESGGNDFILRDKYKREALECIFDFLRDLKGKNIIKLNMLSMKSVHCTLMQEYLKANRVPYAAGIIVRYFISLKGEDFNTYYENRFSKRVRRVNDIKEKKLKNLGSLAYKRISPDGIDEVFEIHDKRWMRKIGNSSFSKGRTKEFYKELALSNDTKFKTTVDAITLNNKILSFIYGFEYNGKASLIRIAHDDDFCYFSPGALIFRKKTEECFFSQMRVVDFGPGFESYKARWSDEFEEVLAIVLPSNNLQSVMIFYIKHWISIKLIGALKKNKRIYNFKKYYLGKIKFLLSRDHISDKILKIKSAADQKGLLIYIIKQFTNLTGKIFSYKQYLILEKHLNNVEMSQSNLQVKEASIDDLEALSEVMNESPNAIIKRFVNKRQCFFTIYNNEIIHYCWLNCSNIEISEVELELSFKKSDVHIYDTFIKRKYRNEKDYRNILSDIFYLLYKKNYKRCYVTLDCSNKPYENKMYKEIFHLKYKILEKKLFGKIKHNAIELN